MRFWVIFCGFLVQFELYFACKNGVRDNASGICQCHSGFTGTNCEKIDDCFRRFESHCSHGYCIRYDKSFNHTCKCYKGYEGELCDVPICIHGKREEDKCVCSPGYGDALCDRRFCVHGEWKAELAKCQCDHGWTGPRCRSLKCVNGSRAKDGRGLFCTCRPGWHGPRCSSKCLHGKFVLKSCECRRGWEGPACDKPACTDGRCPSSWDNIGIQQQHSRQQNTHGHGRHGPAGGWLLFVIAILGGGTVYESCIYLKQFRSRQLRSQRWETSERGTEAGCPHGPATEEQRQLTGYESGLLLVNATRPPPYDPQNFVPIPIDEDGLHIFPQMDPMAPPCYDEVVMQPPTYDQVVSTDSTTIKTDDDTPRETVS